MQTKQEVTGDPMAAVDNEPPPDWIWHGIHPETGATVSSYGRWPLYGWQKRYELAKVQPTEHVRSTATQEPVNDAE